MNHLKSLDLNSSIDLIDSTSVSDGPGEKERLLREKQYEVWFLSLPKLSVEGGIFSG